MTGRRACRIVVTTFVSVYVLSLVLFVIGTFGLLGSPQGPLAGIFVVILGLPWTTLLDPLPDTLRPWAAGLAPALNASILALLCRVRPFR